MPTPGSTTSPASTTSHVSEQTDGTVPFAERNPLVGTGGGRSGGLSKWQESIDAGKFSERTPGTGHSAGWKLAAEAMGIDWMNRDELAQAIPPCFTEYIGRQLLAHLT